MSDKWKHAMQTFTGKLVNVLDPDPETIDIFDIAHQLAMQTRFNGACRTFYSIAQHSVLCSQRAGDYHYPRPREENLALALLMHDAAEAYVGDIVRTIKREVPDFAVFENKMMDAINERFDLPRVAEVPGFKVAIKEVDNRMLVTEKQQIMVQAEPWPIESMFEPYDGLLIDSWTPRAAEALFLSHFSKYRPHEVTVEQVQEILGVNCNA